MSDKRRRVTDGKGPTPPPQRPSNNERGKAPKPPASPLPSEKR